MNRLRETCRRIYRVLPLPLRFFFLPAKVPFRFLDICRLDLWIFRGKEATSQEDLSLAYAGTELNRNYIVNLAYKGQFTGNYLGKALIWRIPGIVSQRFPDCDLLVISLDQHLRRWLRAKEGFVIPLWVASFADISGPGILSSLSKDARYHSKKVLRDGFSYQVTRDHRALREFYDRMYVPYTVNRFGSTALIIPYNEVRRQIRKGELLLVRKDGTHVAGAVVTYGKHYARGRFLGVLHGDPNLLKLGAVTAIYYFSLQRFKERRYKTVHLGSSRAFLRDPLLQHKREWGGTMMGPHDEMTGYFYILPLRHTTGLRQFLVNNPFIFLDAQDGTLNGAIFVEKDGAFSRDDLEAIYKKYYFEGMSTLYIYNFGKGNSDGEALSLPEIPKRIRFVRWEDFLQQRTREK